MITPFKNRSKYGLLKKSLFAIACASSLTLSSAHAQVTTVFYILLENRNWTQNESSNGVQILGDTADCPFLNSLVTPGNPNAAQVSYASCYHNVLANAAGTNPSIHPVRAELRLDGKRIEPEQAGRQRSLRFDR